MRKILTFLFAALMSVGMFAATVTWNSSTLSSINMKSGSFTEDGVTLTLLSGKITGMDSRWIGLSNDASFKFSTSLGNFTRIEITATIYGLGGSGWTETSPGAVWTGEANETTFGMYFRDVSQIVFTIEEPTVAVTGVTLNQNEAQMTVGGETLTLTATVNPNNATDQSVSWSTSDGDVATVDNGVVTAVAAGNATITVTTTDGSFTATCAVTVTAPQPAQEESLLTTLTFGGSETYGETTSGVVTVTATNVGSYNGTYGWLLDEGGSLSVTAKEGYTITKCVFRQNAKAPITDTEAPFEIHANGWGTIIEDPEYDMNGVTSIEVYGYAAPEPQPAEDEITVTWNDPSGYGFEFTKDGVTLTCGEITYKDFYGPGTFTTDLGNFTKIEVYAEGGCLFSGDGWSGDDNQKTWTGNAASVSFSYDIYVPTSIVFTIEPASTPEPQPADQEITPNEDPDHAGVYYSTFYDLANKYALPAGVEAYVATLDGTNLLLSKIADAGQTIPANNAVILKSSVASFTLSISDEEAVSFTATNSLQGTDVSIATPANCYVLAGNNGVGFYHYTASMLNPHKAYVIYSGTPNQAPRRMPFIFDAATGNLTPTLSQGEGEKILRDGQLIIIKNGVKYNAMGQEVK